MHYLSQSDKLDVHQWVKVIYNYFKFHKILFSGYLVPALDG